MKNDQARIEIISEFRRQYPNTATGNDVLEFFLKLERERSPLLAFTFKGDKYQLIQSWLSGYVKG
jgi:hypothetical protein